LISERTRRALGAAKARGVALGGPCQRASESPQFGAVKIPHFGGGGDQPLV
jgi:DNA invertase Pin-like site-specific DNA recombinase